MLIEWFFSVGSLPSLLFGVLCLPGDQSHPFEQPTINPLARCICWAGLLGRAVFPPWNKGPNFGSYMSMAFPQEYWSGLPLPTPGGLPDSVIELESLGPPALVGGFFITSTAWLGMCKLRVCVFPEPCSWPDNLEGPFKL